MIDLLILTPSSIVKDPTLAVDSTPVIDQLVVLTATPSPTIEPKLKEYSS